MKLEAIVTVIQQDNSCLTVAIVQSSKQERIVAPT